MQASKLGADFVAGRAGGHGTNKSKAVIKMENYRRFDAQNSKELVHYLQDPHVSTLVRDPVLCVEALARRRGAGLPVHAARLARDRRRLEPRPQESACLVCQRALARTVQGPLIWLHFLQCSRSYLACGSVGGSPPGALHKWNPAPSPSPQLVGCRQMGYQRHEQARGSGIDHGRDGVRRLRACDPSKSQQPPPHGHFAAHLPAQLRPDRV